LKEIRDRTPNRVQIVTISQTAGTTLPSATPVPPPATGGVSVAGVACSFNDVNDFLLTLQRSPLLDGRSVAIARSEKRSEILDPQVDGVCPGSPADRPEILVDFEIAGNFSEVPSAALLDVLDRQGAVGLATRIRALRDSGAIQTP
jgi:type IV pilus assembly protein PilN